MSRYARPGLYRRRSLRVPCPICTESTRLGWLSSHLLNRHGKFGREASLIVSRIRCAAAVAPPKEGT